MKIKQILLGAVACLVPHTFYAQSTQSAKDSLIIMSDEPITTTTSNEHIDTLHLNSSGEVTNQNSFQFQIFTNPENSDLIDFDSLYLGEPSVPDDSLKLASDSLRMVTDSLALQSDSLLLTADTLVADTVKIEKVVEKKEAKPKELSPLMATQFFLKLVPADEGFRLDTVSRLYEEYIGVLDYLNDPKVPARYLEDNSAYYRMFIPLTYFHAPMERVSKVETVDLITPIENMQDTLLKVDVWPFQEQQRADKVVDNALLHVYVDQPQLVQHYEDDVMGIGYKDNLKKEAESKPTVAKLYGRNSDLGAFDKEASVVIHKPNWWLVGGQGAIKMTQNYLSDNWYKGGDSNLQLLGTFQVYANYNDQEKIQWENLLDAKLGFASTPSDTHHDYMFNTDQLRLYSKMGIRAANKWYYTISTELKTQFCRNYESNSDKLVSSFFAPAYWTSSIGMDYKLNKKKFNLSVFMAPVTHTLVYVGDKNVDETSYGIDEGKRVKHNIGSELQSTLKWRIARNISLDSRLSYLTSYKWVRVELENTMNFGINQYIVASLYVHTRYDDSSAPKSGDSYFQINELLSLGVTYAW